MSATRMLRSHALKRHAGPLLLSTSVLYTIRPQMQTLLCDGPITLPIGRNVDYDLKTSMTNSYPLPQQLSSGSIIGLLTGLGISTFSKSLSLVIGFGVILVQWASSMGINVLPWKRIQSYFKGVDIDRLVHENVAFKIAFGSSLAVATFLR